MPVRTWILVGLALSLAGVVSAQITLQYSDFPFEYGVSQTRGYGDNFIAPGLAGGNMSWNYADQPTVFDVVEHYVDPSGQPGADSFPTANLAITYEYQEVVSQLAFYITDGSSISLLGFVIISNDVPYPFIPDEVSGALMTFPLSYGDEWDVVTRITVDEDTNVDSTHYIVDGWGSITDAAGTFDCLRVRLNGTSTRLPDGDVETDIDYMWLAANWGEVCKVESEDDEDDPNYEGGSFDRIHTITGWSAVAESNPAAATEFSLLPVYPNPFNPTATVPFTLDRPAQVRLTLVNTLGQQVAVLTDAAFAPGQHMVPLNASTLAAGSYLVRLDINGQQLQAQRVTLVK